MTLENDHRTPEWTSVHTMNLCKVAALSFFLFLDRQDFDSVSVERALSWKDQHK